MRFAEFPVYDASGVELACPVLCQGKTLKAGRVLTSKDIELLRRCGIKSVFGALLSPNDLRADTATEMILKAMVGNHLRYTLVQKGYTEIFADVDGMFVAKTDRLLRFNTHDESIILSSISPYMPVYKNQLVASLHLSGMGFASYTINQAIDKITGQGELISVAPYAFCRLGYIQTAFVGQNPSVLDEQEVIKRFSIYGFNTMFFGVAEHAPLDVEQKIRDALDLGAEVILIESPIAPCHRNDVVPMAIKEAAGDIDRLGLPLDPSLGVVIGHKNNSILVGYSANDFKTPAFDRFLRFLATKSLPPTEELPALATSSMSLERMIQFLTPKQEASSIVVDHTNSKAKIGIVILAAGSSRRMIGINKLLEPIQGIKMIERAVQSALSSKADYVFVVTGYEAPLVEKALKNYDVKIVRNSDFGSGVLSSMRLGLSLMPNDVVGAMVLPADMIGFTSQYLDQLIDLFDPNTKSVCLPSHNGVRYNPVLWPKELFKNAKIVPEDTYGLPALIEHSDYIKELKLTDDIAVLDINTLGDISAFCARADLMDAVEKELLALERKK